MRRDLLLRYWVECLLVAIDGAAWTVVEAGFPLCLPHLDCRGCHISFQVNICEVHCPFFGWVILAARRNPPTNLCGLIFFTVHCENILKREALFGLNDYSNLVAHCLFTRLIDACPACLSI